LVTVAFFLPGRAKDLSAPRYILQKCSMMKRLEENWTN